MNADKPRRASRASDAFRRTAAAPPMLMQPDDPPAAGEDPTVQQPPAPPVAAPAADAQPRQPRARTAPRQTPPPPVRVPDYVRRDVNVEIRRTLAAAYKLRERVGDLTARLAEAARHGMSRDEMSAAMLAAGLHPTDLPADPLPPP